MCNNEFFYLKKGQCFVLEISRLFFFFFFKSTNFKMCDVIIDIAKQLMEVTLMLISFES